MNISLKTLIIFCLVAATTATNVTSSTTDTPTSTSNATTVTTEAPANTTTGTSTTSITIAANTTTVTQAPANTTTGTSTTSITTAANTTTVTQAPGQTSTAPANTTTGASTTSITTAANTTTVTQAPGQTSTGTVNTNTTTNSTGSTSVSTAAATTTITTQGPCASSPCIGDSTCEERFGGLFACICRPGLVYLEMSGCFQTKIFPGNLSLDREFQEEMANKQTKLFQNTAHEIEEALRRILGDDNGYINSTVLSLRRGSIIAEVQNFYELSSNATSESVNRVITEGGAGIADFTTFKGSSACNTGYCDSTTTECEDKAGIPTCTCKQEYLKSQSTSQACLACPNGQMAFNNSEGCKKCPFGFSGFNCSDPYLLVVTVVSTVLGALLIIFIVALTVVSCRNQKGSSSSHVDYSSSYSNEKLHKPTGVSRIPRANPDANKLEMTDSGANQRYTDYDEDMSNRVRIPPPYGGKGAENGGVHNPYFQHDDDKMRRY